MPSPANAHARLWFGLKTAALLLYVAVVIRTAWLNDDAYITFRTVENVYAGYGLTWNPAERVQAYTHPLWLFLLLIGRGLTGEVYYSSLWLSIGLATLTAWLVGWRLSASPQAAVLALLAMTFSKAYVDFSTSGLENVLSHLLLALFLIVYVAGSGGRRIFWLSLLTAAGALTRPDALLIFLPPLLLALWETRSRQTLLQATLGFLPLLLWEVFSVFYYGFPFPNTAYAKIGTGIPAAALAGQGLVYLGNSLRWDPLTPAVIAAGLVAAIIGRERRARLVALGVVLYLLYVVRVGGDFMSGRFLTLPFLAALGLLIGRWSPQPVARVFDRPLPFAAALLVVVGLGFAANFPTVLSDGQYGRLPQHQENWRDGDIADERVYYYPHTGLLNPARTPHPWREQGETLRAQGQASASLRVVEHGNVGFLGYYAGPEVHIVDRNALTDPLLARLPVRDPQNWRVGHYRRDVPAGYVETLRSGVNVIQDPALAAFYDHLRPVVRGPLWDRARLAEIVRLNLGRYDDLLPQAGGR